IGFGYIPYCTTSQSKAGNRSHKGQCGREQAHNAHPRRTQPYSHYLRANELNNNINKLHPSKNRGSFHYLSIRRLRVTHSSLITLAGIPPIMTFAGKTPLTTAPVAIMLFSPITEF